MMKSKSPSEPIPRRGRARPAAAAVLAVGACLFSTPAGAQRPPADTSQTVMTIVTSPADAWVTLSGSSEVSAASPLELQPQWTGRYAVTIDAPGYATARGALFIPERGSAPYALSEPPGISPGLVLHSLYFPGVPHLLTRRSGRAFAFLAAGAGGLGAVARDQLEYRSKLKQTDLESQDRAGDFRYARDRWAIYTGVVWGMSALDYIVRARMDLIESTATRVTIAAPEMSRIDVVWRSILVPGAGQDYANRRDRGLFWLGATFASGAAYFVAVESRNRILTKLDRAEALLATASPAEVPDRQTDVNHFTSLAERSRKLVDGLALGTAGIYVANILDAGIVPIGGSSAERSKVSISTPVSPRRAEIVLTYRF